MHYSAALRFQATTFHIHLFPTFPIPRLLSVRLGPRRFGLSPMSRSLEFFMKTCENTVKDYRWQRQLHCEF
ncbi:uncharacterized, partial [Tachysurus ichikawai]